MNVGSKCAVKIGSEVLGLERSMFAELIETRDDKLAVQETGVPDLIGIAQQCVLMHIGSYFAKRDRVLCQTRRARESFCDLVRLQWFESARRQSQINLCKTS